MSAAQTPSVGVAVEVADGVGWVRLQRPERLNALDGAAKTALRDGLADLADDDAVRCVVLMGTGRAFCVGQDLQEHAALLEGPGPEAAAATVAEHWNPIALRLHTMPKPVVAAVNGVAAGAGAALCLLADLRVLAASASVTTAFAGIGLTADTGSSWTLPRLVGHGRATELLYSGRRVEAEEALRIGLATEVVPDADLEAHVGALAARLAAGPTLAFATLRRTLAYGAAHDLESTLAVEAEGIRATGASADHRDAVQAFLAKRRPTFTGR